MSSCVLVVADPERIAELVAALSEPLPSGMVEVLVSSGGDDTIDLFVARRPQVVVVTATLDTGDTRSLIEAVRDAIPRAEIAVIVIGDETGPVRTSLDAMDLEPDRFVPRPLSKKALQLAVSNALDAVAVARGGPGAAHALGSARTASGTSPPRTTTPLGYARAGEAVAVELGDVASSMADSGRIVAAASAASDSDRVTKVVIASAGGVGDAGDVESSARPPGDGPSSRDAMRARWAALADSIEDAGDSEIDEPMDAVDEAPPLPPIVIHPRRTPRPPVDDNTPPPLWPAAGAPESEWLAEPSAPTREPTLIIPDQPPLFEAAVVATPAELARAEREGALGSSGEPALGGRGRPRTEPPYPRLQTEPPFGRDTLEPPYIATESPFGSQSTEPHVSAAAAPPIQRAPSVLPGLPMSRAATDASYRRVPTEPPDDAIPYGQTPPARRADAAEERTRRVAPDFSPDAGGRTRRTTEPPPDRLRRPSTPPSGIAGWNVSASPRPPESLSSLSPSSSGGVQPGESVASPRGLSSPSLVWPGESSPALAVPAGELGPHAVASDPDTAGTSSPTTSVAGTSPTSDASSSSVHASEAGSSSAAEPGAATPATPSALARVEEPPFLATIDDLDDAPATAGADADDADLGGRVPRPRSEMDYSSSGGVSTRRPPTAPPVAAAKGGSTFPGVTPAVVPPAAPGTPSSPAIASPASSTSTSSALERARAASQPSLDRTQRGGHETAPPPPSLDRAPTHDAPPLPRADTEDSWPMVRSPATPQSPPSASTAATATNPRVRVAATPSPPAPPQPLVARTNTVELSSMLSPEDRARFLAEVAPPPLDSVVVAERGPDEHWSEPMPLAELLDRDRDRDSRRDVRDVRDIHAPPVDELGLDDFDDDLVLGQEPDAPALADLAPPRVRGHAGHAGHSTHASDVVAPMRAKTQAPAASPPSPSLASSLQSLHDRPADERPGGRDFARQLRAKMSQMAQRLFQGGDGGQEPDDLAPRHDHHTEIDLNALGEEQPLGGGVTEIEARPASRAPVEAPPTTSPGSWDTHVRERGLADQGDLVRGVSDAAPLLAKMFAHTSTGRIAFRKDDVEKIVFFDQGRPVFASSNEQGDRMGQLLVREGKITASQYERCQTQVAESGRRMGEILVDFGYLKRRELLPAVRRHVEDILYSLFGWPSGRYHVVIEPTPSAERIRLSRHPASLILEGIRRKLDRTTLERLVGPSTTVIELPDRDKLGGIVNLADLAPEERASLAAFDGQADLSAVARTVGIDVADVLPLAWGLCVLGLANARRTDAEVPEESTALVGETDLVIDRERVRGRWQLVTEADYFALLGVRRDATAFEIRRAYQAARRDFAADCFPQDLRRELAQELEDIAHVLDEAFRVLRDDCLRNTYLTNLVE